MKKKALFSKPFFWLFLWFLFLTILVVCGILLPLSTVREFVGIFILGFLLTPPIALGLCIWAFCRGIKQLKTKNRKYGVINVLISIVLIMGLVLILKFVFQFTVFSPFGYGCAKGLGCFPEGEFSDDYINCGILNSHYSNDSVYDIKKCILDSKDKCINAYARFDYYGIEGQTGVSNFIVVEKEGANCTVQEYTADGNTKINQKACNLVNDSSDKICDDLDYGL